MNAYGKLNYYGKNCIKDLNAIGIYPNEIYEFTVNTRAKGRWGQARVRNGIYTININADLLEDNCPEKALRETLYHELLHCVDGCMNHGAKWNRLADLVNDCYSMNITRTSSTEEKVGTEYAQVIKAKAISELKVFSIKCTSCGTVSTKRGNRAPKWYAHPNNFRCGKCKTDTLVRC